MAQSKDICEILNYLDENDVKIKGYKFYSRNYVAQLFAIEKAVFKDLEEGVQDDESEEEMGNAIGAEESDGEEPTP